MAPRHSRSPYTPVRVGQAASGIVLYIGADAWVTQVGGIAADPAADNPEDAVNIVAGEGETFTYSTNTRVGDHLGHGRRTAG